MYRLSSTHLALSCRSTEPQTNWSPGLRITAIVLGMIAIIVAYQLLSGHWTPLTNRTIAGYITLSLGIILCAAGVSLQCVKRPGELRIKDPSYALKLLNVPPEQAHDITFIQAQHSNLIKTLKTRQQEVPPAFQQGIQEVIDKANAAYRTLTGGRAPPPQKEASSSQGYSEVD